MIEDLLDDVGVGDEGDDDHGGTTAGAEKGVDVEHAAQELCPCQDSRKEAKAFISNWIIEAKAMGNRHLTRFAQTVEERIKSILDWYKHPITSGPLEGMNNKIKVLKRMAYGFRDMRFFALRIMFIHETKAELTGA